MRVAEGVDLQGADVGWEEGEVLRGGGEHVPGVEVEEGGVEVQSDRGSQRHGEVGEDVVSEGNAICVFTGELADDDVDCREGGVDHDDAVDDHGCEI